MQSGLEPSTHGAPGVWPGAAVLVGPGGMVNVDPGPVEVGPPAVDVGAVELVVDDELVTGSVVVEPLSSSELQAIPDPRAKATTTTASEIR